MEPLRTCACIGMLVLPIACRTAGGSGVSKPPAELAEEARAAALEAASLAEVAPEFADALAMVQVAVQAGDDDTARAVLDRVFWRGPRGKALAVANAFERVLDGRAALRELALALVIVPEPPEPARPTGTDAKEPRPPLAGLWFVARNTGAERLRLAPGPATLLTLHHRLDVRAALSTTSAVHPFPDLADLVVEPGAEARVRLSVFFLAAAEGALAERMDFRLDLRAGSVTRGERELPAQRFQVREAEELALSAPLAARGASTVEELEALVSAGRVHERDALDLALRLPASERGGALDLLARRVGNLSHPDLKELVPALRWLAADGATSGDPAEWRRLLEARANPRRAPRENLVLPPAAARG